MEFTASQHFMWPVLEHIPGIHSTTWRGSGSFTYTSISYFKCLHKHSCCIACWTSIYRSIERDSISYNNISPYRITEEVDEKAFWKQVKMFQSWTLSSFSSHFDISSHSLKICWLVEILWQSSRLSYCVNSLYRFRCTYLPFEMPLLSTHSPIVSNYKNFPFKVYSLLKYLDGGAKLTILPSNQKSASKKGEIPTLYQFISPTCFVITKVFHLNLLCQKI